MNRITFITNVGDKPCQQATISETTHLDNVKVQVNNKVVYLLGMADTQDDIARIHSIVNSLRGIRSIRNNLQVSA